MTVHPAMMALMRAARARTADDREAALKLFHELKRASIHPSLRPSIGHAIQKLGGDVDLSLSVDDVIDAFMEKAPEAFTKDQLVEFIGVLKKAISQERNPKTTQILIGLQLKATLAMEQKKGDANAGSRWSS